MYGPPTDPQQIPVDFPNIDIGLSILAGCLISSLSLIKSMRPSVRAWFFILGQVVLLTAPLFMGLDSSVFGDYPTIDKTGSFLYYQDGVHIRALLHPIASLDDCAVQLIGVHLGHLWITGFFDLFLDEYGPLNVQALLYPALAWWMAALFFRELVLSPRQA